MGVLVPEPPGKSPTSKVFKKKKNHLQFQYQIHEYDYKTVSHKHFVTTHSLVYRLGYHKVIAVDYTRQP